MIFFNKKGKLSKKSVKVVIILKKIKVTKISLCDVLLPTKRRNEASKTPIPLGAVGIIKPIDQDMQKITSKKRSFVL